MQLLSFFNSSTSYRVRIALALKGIEYSYNGVNIRLGDQTSTSHIQVNPAKGVPVLITEDGTALSQSLAIIDYLEKDFPKSSLLPSNGLTRARIMEFANLIACDIHPVNNLRVLKYLTQNFNVSEEEKKTWYKHWVDEGLTAAETLLNKYGSGPYCFGETPTLADICLVPQIANAQRFGCELEPYKQLMKVYQHCIVQPAFIAAEPTNQPDFIN